MCREKLLRRNGTKSWERGGPGGKMVGRKSGSAFKRHFTDKRTGRKRDINHSGNNKVTNRNGKSRWPNLRRKRTGKKRREKHTMNSWEDNCTEKTGKNRYPKRSNSSATANQCRWAIAVERF